LGQIEVRSAGRVLTIEDYGEPNGKTVFLLHGTPGSRLGPRPRSIVLHQMGVRLIAFDRPGYGGSDRKFGRTVADAAADVAAIADDLGIGQFAVLGRSGGGPHALACAALLADRTTKVAALVGLAPSGVDGLDWFAGMTEANVTEFSAARLGHKVVAERLERAAKRIRANPSRMIEQLYADLTESDRQVVADIGIRRMLVDNYAEGLRHSAAGWIDDVMAFTSPWGFDPGDIMVPTLLWHGAEDRFTPPDHGVWLGDRIPDAISLVAPGGSHFDAIRMLPNVIPWLIGQLCGSVRRAATRDPG
jgi:pimeloyl-ACP methyl ester carboxylesterase